MNRLTKNLACGLLAVLLGAVSLTGCTAKPLDGTKTIATLDDETLTLGTASFLLRYNQAQMEVYSAMFGNSGSMWGDSNDKDSYGYEMKQTVQDQIEEMMLLKAHAKDYDISLSEEDQKKIDETAQSFMDTNSEDTLKKLAASKEDIVSALELYAYKSKVYTPMTDGIDMEVSDEEAAQSSLTYVRFSTSAKKNDSGEEVELTEEEKAALKEQAQTVLDKVKSSSDPANADIDAISKEVDDSLLTIKDATFGSDDTTLDDAVKAAVADLTDGQVVPQVVEGKESYFVVRLDKKFDEEATQKKKESILKTRRDDEYKKIMDEWKKDDGFSMTKSLWKKLTLTDQESYSFKQQETPSVPDEGVSAEGENPTGGSGSAKSSAE